MSTDAVEIGSMTSSTDPDVITLEGKRFRLTIRQSESRSWHWILAIPGELVLSGDAVNYEIARQEAQSAAEAWLDEQTVVAKRAVERPVAEL